MPIYLFKDGEPVAAMDARTMWWSAGDAELEALLNRTAPILLCAPDEPPFNDPAKGRAFAMALLLGCDVIDTEQQHNKVETG